ncbi:MAG TPA: TetR/AcrR family transcriptional regulator [Pseudonocardia sp.]|nr:TetR/AcrR family transcriptional regulator [Pseudonocardia sp.]
MVVRERRTQAQRTAESRRRLVDAAIALLAERGYSGTTLLEIGRASGLSRGLVTHHFGTKEACMEAVVVAIRERLTAIVNAATREVRGLDAIDTLIDVYFAQMRSEDSGARAMYTVLTEAVTAAPGLRTVTARNNEVFRRVITGRIMEAAAAGESIPEVDPEVTAILVEGMVRGVAAQWLIAPEDIDLDVVVAELKRVVRRSLTAP